MFVSGRPGDMGLTTPLEITILVYSSLSPSAPQMVCRVVAAELTETL